ncbi:osmotically-inducible lipoprotein OsmE [Pseudomonas songnenensis]|jgi:osmotically inducible lipoprotein OsmE|uniref:Osmotically-inducible lipoprotein OsmE n=1 Tax=Pseudomonas songnenensis TaxID=1176259 RepID=A0A482U4N6_9PSED|nr:osmotically-inducible lipoprotein OsmE [Pseudomonas songnenensis]AWM58871.1 osmotically-inducible lipoprotein OsmE [Stutzerimonas stutzeri]OCX95557.1 MAG: transcriptional regulator [Pseudomonas sp. CO183]MCQ4300032.1 osmotically-inducible lipoprotein OsmE [Pseudomonas songnenensis]RMH95694.1 osmotically-inducible lipoprotein OsmE [Pseudomonas songnenensis]RYJ62209.1 osmotically-inducible lipoprotein OsmE [Pseudomonas songnenensis]
MLNRTIYAIVPTLLLVGCSGNVQNPVDRITFRDEPLVRDVENGMSQARVLTIGGEPSRTSGRSVVPGLCHDYILNRDGKQQPYYVSFDGTGRVDGQGFLTCRQLEENQRNLRR